MAEPTEIPGVSKFESTLLVLFIPSVDRKLTPIDQERWEGAALESLGRGSAARRLFRAAAGSGGMTPKAEN